MRTVWPSRHDGHHRVGTAGFGPRFGAAMAIATAVAPTTTDPSASAQRQSPWAGGGTPAGVLRAFGAPPPPRIPAPIPPRRAPTPPVNQSAPARPSSLE